MESTSVITTQKYLWPCPNYDISFKTTAVSILRPLACNNERRATKNCCTVVIRALKSETITNRRRSSPDAWIPPSLRKKPPKNWNGRHAVELPSFGPLEFNEWVFLFIFDLIILDDSILSHHTLVHNLSYRATATYLP